MRLFQKHQKGHLKHLGHKLKDHFIPHEGNNHHPHALKHHALFGYSLLLVILKVLVISVQVAFPTISVFSTAITPANVVSLTNQARINLGIQELTSNHLLMAAAQAKANDMKSNTYFSHTSPEGLTPWTFIRGQGYAYQVAGENLAIHYTEAEDVQAGWMASPTHRQNIVDDRFTQIGVGVAQGDYEGYFTTYVVQMFATPIDPEPAPESVSVPEEIQEPVTAQVEDEGNVAGEATQGPVGTPEPDSAPEPPSEPTESPQITEDAPEVQLTPEPKESTYLVNVSGVEADAVTARLGTETSPLLFDPVSGNWQGQVAYNPKTIDANGSAVSVVIEDDSKTKEHAVALIAPKADVGDVYAFNQPNEGNLKLFGFIQVDSLGDNVRKFYILTIVALGALLVMNTLIKVEVQRHSVLAHSLLVIVLAGILAVL